MTQDPSETRGYQIPVEPVHVENVYETPGGGNAQKLGSVGASDAGVQGVECLKLNLKPRLLPVEQSTEAAERRGQGVIVQGPATAKETPVSPPVADTKAPAADDVDLFGEETEEEKKAVEERAAVVKASTKKKESGKSSILLDVKPLDDERNMKKLEEVVRSVQLEGLLWGASKLVPVGYGIKKLQIMLTIVDDLVSVDTLIEERLTEELINEYVQSCDIVAFNKISDFLKRTAK